MFLPRPANNGERHGIRPLDSLFNIRYLPASQIFLLPESGEKARGAFSAFNGKPVFTGAWQKMKVLSIPYTHTLSHISRPLSIAKELRTRGHEVVFAGESPKIRFIKAEGFEVLPLHEPDPEVLFGNIREGKLRFVSDEEVERMVEADRALYKAVRPDLVLTDGRFSSLISTQITGLKHAAIVNVSSTAYRAFPYFPLFERVPERLAGRDTLDRINLRLEMFVFDNVMSVFKRLSKRWRLKNTVTATNCLTGNDLTLLSDVPEYFPARGLPRSYHYVGPLTWKAHLPPPSWWPPQKGGMPLIYVTMGTTGAGDFFQRAYELFKASELNAVFTTGAQAGGDMRTIDGRIFVEPFMDGDTVMEECDMAVCHGGNGTIYQALQHGKPVIGIPAIPDQLYNMRRVEALGIGRMISWKDFSNNPSKLLDLVRSVLRDRSFYSNASRFREILGEWNAPVKAADIICGYVS